ncbi:MAG: hypothetical protein WD926_00830 [Patescibacteria group bacterium]
MGAERQRSLPQAETGRKLTPAERIDARVAELRGSFDPDALSVGSVREADRVTGRLTTLLVEAQAGAMLVDQVRHWAATNRAYAERMGIGPDASLEDVLPVAYELAMKRVDTDLGKGETKGARKGRVRREFAQAERGTIRQLASYRMHSEHPQQVDRFTARLKERRERLAADANRQESLPV